MNNEPNNPTTDEEERKREQVEAHRQDRAALQSLTNWIVRGNG